MPLTGFGANVYLRCNRVAQDEKIPPCALHSLDEGKTLMPIINDDTVGQTPADFSKERSFWKIEQVSRVD